MILVTPDYCRIMARYNHWQNESLATAAETISDTARREDRGAFWGSMFGTFNHLLWGDCMWLSRFKQVPPPPVDLPDSATLMPDWPEFINKRREIDQVILDWTAKMTEADTQGELHYHSTAFGGQLTRPVAVGLVHFFNHQTHHRGQIHEMLTAAGAKPDITDLIGLPELMDPTTT